MKLLVFAHIPPPHHGQSYMVKLMLDGFGGDQREKNATPPAAPYNIECYHIDVRLSQRLEEIGDMRIGKIFLLFFHCLRAIWCRFRYGLENFYYVPTPGKTSALYRDWLVMLLCRPFFKRVILHWHAAGLAKWLETCAQIRTRAFTYRLMKDVDLSIVLSRYNRADAEKLFPKKIEVVSNGIPDPCPGYERDLLPRRQARLESRRRLLSGETLSADLRSQAGGDPQIVQVLYLAHCTRQKGAFDAMTGVALANKKLAAQGSPISLRLTVTGSFVTADDKTAFDKLMSDPAVANCVHYAGFVSGDQKEKLLRSADLFCFPTFYPNENQPVNIIEAMAFGLPVLTTRWRSLPEVFPEGYPGLVDVRSPEQVAGCLIELLAEDGETLRQMYLRNFTLDSYLSGLATAFHALEQDNPRPALVPRTHAMNFSIVTPSFRQSAWLKLCVASIADQAGVTLEHIVQDSCSEDDTKNWLPHDPRVKACIEKDSGMYDAVNRGWRRAQGDILAYLNCDEQYLPGALKVVHDFFQANPNIEVAFADSIVTDSDGKYICHRPSIVPSKSAMWVRLPVLTSGIFIRRSVVHERGILFDTQWRDLGDFWWIRELVLRGVPMTVLPELTSIFADTGENMNLKPNARREEREKWQRSPRWVKLLKFFLIAQTRARFIMRAASHRQPFDYSIFTLASPSQRAVFHAARPTTFWKGRFILPVPAAS